MALTVASLAISVAANTGQAQSGILGLARMIGPGGMFFAAGIAAAAVVAGVGIASIKMAGDFQTGVTSLVTGAGESRANIGMMSKAILQMAVDTGTSTQQLVAGAYAIGSAGFHGAAGLDVLKAAAEGAKVGQADLGVVADATTTLMTDFGSQTGGATGAVNALIGTVSRGKTHLADLASSLSAVAPTASAAGVGLNDMLGALATMTGEGVPAANAATYLRQTIISLDAPGKLAVTTLNSLGISAAQVANGMRVSLPSTLAMITDALGKKFPQGAALAQAEMAKVKSGSETFNQALQNLSGTGAAGYIDALKNIAGGSKTMQGMLDLTGTHLQTFQGNVAGITGAVEHGGKSINGWSLVQGTFNQKMDRAKEVVETLMIKLGTGLLPVAGNLADMFANNLPGAINAVVSGFTQAVAIGTRVVTFMQGASPAADAVKFAILTLGGAMLAFAASQLPALVVAFIGAMPVVWGYVTAMASAAMATLIAAAPFIAIGAVIALVAVGIYELITHWSQVSAFFKNLGAAIGGFLSGVWHDITSTVASWGTAFHNGVAFIQNAVKAGFALVYNIIMTPIHDIDALFAWLFNHNTYFHDLVLGIQKELATGKAIITTFGNDIKGLFTAAGNFIKQTAQRDWNAVETYIIQPIQRAQATVRGVITTVEGDLSRAWGIVSGDAQSAWNRFTGLISNAVGTVKTDVTNIANAILSPITNLGGQMFSFGSHLIQMLINGITSMAGAVGNAAGNIMHNITSVLGFHSPTEKGEGATADRWMPALGAMLISGLNAQAAPAGAAANKIAAAISTGIKSATAPSALGVSGNANISGLPAGMQQMNGLATATQNGQPIQITIVMDGKKVAQVVAKQLPSVLRNATGTRNF